MDFHKAFDRVWDNGLLYIKVRATWDLSQYPIMATRLPDYIVSSLSKLGSRVPLTINSRQVFPKDLTLDRFCSWHTSTIC